MQADFSIDIEWRSWTDDNLSQAEATTACDLEIRLADESLTQNIDENGCMRKSVFVSALPFAWWLCVNFWRICYEPGLPRASAIPVTALESWRIAHCMTSIGEGYAWPEVTFFSDGSNERICCLTQAEQDSCNQPIRFVAGMQATCPKNAFMDACVGFVKAAARRVGDATPDFLSSWKQLQEEYADEAVANYRIIEAILGHDIGYAPISLMNKIISAIDRIDWDVLCETVGGLNPVYGVEFANQDIAFEKAIGSMTAGITARIELPRMKVESVFPWEAGRRLATRVREMIGIGMQKPFGRARLLDCMGLTASRFNRIATAGPVSISRVKGQETALVFPTRGSGRYATSRLFQLARALGALISLPEHSRWMVISSSQTAEQQLQRNFAAELLAPFNAIKSMLPHSRWPVKKDILGIANYFQTSPQTIVHSLVNHGALDSDFGKMLLT